MTIKVELPDALYTVFDGPARYRVAYGGRGSAKSWGFAIMAAIKAYERPRRILCARELQNSIKDSVHKLLAEQIERLKLPGFEIGQSYIRHVNGSEFIFRGLRSNASEIKSMEGIDIAWVEEAQKVSDESWELLIPTIRKEDSEIWVTLNPELKSDSTSQRFIENPPPNAKILKINYDQNPWFPAELREEMEYLKATDIDAYRHVWEGEYRQQVQGAVCKGWGRENVEPTPYRPELPIYLTCDFNIDPMSWALAHRFNDEYHFFDEICMEHTTTTEAAEEFVRRYGDHRAGVTITGDASGNNRNTKSATVSTTDYTIIKNVLVSAQIPKVETNIRPANPPVQDRIAAWNALVCNSLGHRRIKVDPKCKWLIWNCENLFYLEGGSVIWEPTQREKDKDRKLKFVKHVFDAASYLVERYDSIKLKQPLQNKNNQVVTRVFRP